MLAPAQLFRIRGAENRTRTSCSQSMCTTTILLPGFEKLFGHEACMPPLHHTPLIKNFHHPSFMILARGKQFSKGQMIKDIAYVICPLYIHRGKSSRRCIVALLPSSSTITAATSNCHGVSDETYLTFRYVWIIRPNRRTFWRVMLSSGRNLSFRIPERIYACALSRDVSCVTSCGCFGTIPVSDFTSMKCTLPFFRATTSSSPHRLLKFLSRIV